MRRAIRGSCVLKAIRAWTEIQSEEVNEVEYLKGDHRRGLIGIIISLREREREGEGGRERKREKERERKRERERVRERERERERVREKEGG